MTPPKIGMLAPNNTPKTMARGIRAIAKRVTPLTISTMEFTAPMVNLLIYNSTKLSKTQCLDIVKIR